jgi:hypothetical protein
MPAITEYATGTPTWVDVASPDHEASASFYGGLFGWEVQDPGPQFGGYKNFALRGTLVAGLAMHREEGGPPMWTTYIATADADATAAKVSEAGGQVLFAPMDVMDLGRMAVFMDSVGAVFGAWQAGTHHGSGIVNEPGAPIWHELGTRDTDSAKKFYGHVFGWGAIDQHAPGGDYTQWTVDGRSVGGMMHMGEQFPAGVPSYWLPYFAVQDCAEAVARARELGAAVMVDPMEIEIGTFSVMADPHGATFAVIAMKEGMEV